MAEYSPLFGFESTTTVQANYSKVAEAKGDIADAAAQSKSDQPFDFLGVAKTIQQDLTQPLADVKNAADAHVAKADAKRFMGEISSMDGEQQVAAIEGRLKELGDTNKYSTGFREGALSVLEYGLGSASVKAEGERVDRLVGVSASEYTVAHQRAVRLGIPINLEEYTKRVAEERRLPIPRVRDALMYSNLESNIDLLSSVETVDEYKAIKADLAEMDKVFNDSVMYFGSQSGPMKEAMTARRAVLNSLDGQVKERLISDAVGKIDSTLLSPADPNGIRIRNEALADIRAIDPSKYDSERRRAEGDLQKNIAIAVGRNTYKDATSVIPDNVYGKDKQFYQDSTRTAIWSSIDSGDMNTLNTIITHRPDVVKDIADDFFIGIMSATDEQRLGQLIDVANKIPKDLAERLMTKEAYDLQESIDVLRQFSLHDDKGTQLSALRLRDLVLNAPESVNIANKGLEATYFDQAGKIEANTTLRTGAVDEYKRLYRLMYANAAETGISPSNLASAIKNYVEKKYEKNIINGMEYQTSSNDYGEHFSDYAYDVISSVHPTIKKEDIVIRGGHVVDPLNGNPVFMAYVKTPAGLQHIPNINLTKAASEVWRLIDNPPPDPSLIFNKDNSIDESDYLGMNMDGWDAWTESPTVKAPPIRRPEGYYSDRAAEIDTSLADATWGFALAGTLPYPDMFTNNGLGEGGIEVWDNQETIAQAAKGQRQASFDLVQGILNHLVVRNNQLVNPETIDTLTEVAINKANEIVIEVTANGRLLTEQEKATNATYASTIDFKFIGGLEGELQTTGYVPVDDSGEVLGVSGVTISTGVDLGQWSEADLQAAGVSAPLLKKVKPYLGLQGDAALLKASNLHISTAEAVELFNKVKTVSINRLKRSWNNSNPTTPWSKLSYEQKTVLASVSFQYGTMARNPKTRNLWGYATSGDWSQFSASLREFGEYTTRRNKEADYLEGAG
jgi:hypothetical protein